MALGLNKMQLHSVNSLGNSVSLRNLLSNRKGFPNGYLPALRTLDGVDYIHTFGEGNDVDNGIVFYKWIFIDPNTMNTTIDSDQEYAKIPNNGYIMRIMQRSLIPYYENFVIDYYEDINAMRVVSISDDQKNAFENKVHRITRLFPSGDSAVPAELKQEIYSYPEAFFKRFIESAIPIDLRYQSTGAKKSSNHISDYGFSGNSKYALNINPAQRRSAFSRRSNDTPKNISETGLHYQIY